MHTDKQQNAGGIVQYADLSKENEKAIVESNLAPVVRTYDELRAALQFVSGITKVATSGFFNPIHRNHISNIVSSKKLDELFLNKLGLPTETHLTVVVNGDWSTRKKLGGELFMAAETRADIVRAIKGVDLVFIHDVEEVHQGSLIGLGLFDVFTKGGDRDFDSLPKEEQVAIIRTQTVLVGNVGYEKKEGTQDEVSSSKLRQIAKT